MSNKRITQRGVQEDSYSASPARAASDPGGQGPGSPNGKTTAPPVNKPPARGATDPGGQGPGSPNRKTTAPPVNKPPARGATTKANKIIPNVRYPPVAKATNGTQRETSARVKHETETANRKERRLPSPSDLPLGVDVELDSRVTDAVEMLTRGQSNNPKWFAWRHNRITASNAHRVAHSRFANGRSITPPQSYLTCITGRQPNVRTRAMTWGVENEAVAVRHYRTLKSQRLGRDVQVRECGLFVDPRRPWLAASPDGIVLDGKERLCLEVKCPYKHRHNTVRQACLEDRAFCLELEVEEGAPRYGLKTDHSYYTQIQCQLAVTGTQRADLVVYTLKETAIVPVTFNPGFWEETVTKLERFYRDAVLPCVRLERIDGVAFTPEE